MKSVEFVYFKRNKYNLYSAEAEENCVVLRNYLESVGAEHGQYFSDTLPNVFDIVDDILSEYMNVVCFFVNIWNKDFTLAVAEALKQSGEEVEIIFICENEVNITAEVDVALSADSAKEGLKRILEITENDCEDLSANSIMAYQNSFFPLRACSEYGVILNKYIPVLKDVYVANCDDVIKEISYISRYVSHSTQILLNSEDISGYPYLDVLLEKLKALSTPQEIFIKIPKKQMTEQLVSKLSQANVLVLPKEEEDFSYGAVLNGLQSYYLGYYPNNLADGYTKHIQIEKGEIEPGLLRKLSSHNAANSAIYGVGSSVNKTYTEVKEAAGEAMYLLTNYLSFEEIQGTQEVSVDINGKENVHSFNMEPYSEYKTAEIKSSFVNVNTEKDLGCFIDDIARFNQSGVIHNDRMWKPLIIDKCRWSFDGMCSLNKLLRFRVSQGKVYPCISCNKSIGNVERLHFELQKNACVEMDKEQVKRKCDECSEKMVCVKCSMLPEFLPEEKYCELMKSDLDIARFSKNMLGVKYLFEIANINLLKGCKAQELLFVTKQNHLEIDEMKQGSNCYIDDHTLFIKISSTKSAYIAFNMKTKKALSLNKNLFIICELLYKGLAFEEIKQYMCCKYQIDEKEANEVLKEGVSILKDNGYLQNGGHRDVL